MKSKYYFSLKTISVFLLITAVLMMPAASNAQSLWVDGQKAQKSGLFADRQARNVGDIITIIINESTTGSVSGSAQNSKSSSVDLKGGGVRGGPGWLDLLSFMRQGYSDNFKTQGSQSNTNKIQGRVTVTVVEVLPSGLLSVSGTQSLMQNKETQKITIAGLIRPEDVSFSNTVLSSNVADASIKIENKGPIGRKQRQGILSQVFNFLF